MSTVFMWDGKEVIHSSWAGSRHHRGMLCVDTGESDPEYRYGRFVTSNTWEPVPFDEFPPAFKVHLLLLGVS